MAETVFEARDSEATWFQEWERAGEGLKQDINTYALNEYENDRHERLGSVRMCGGNAGGEVPGSSDQITEGLPGHNKKF